MKDQNSLLSVTRKGAYNGNGLIWVLGPRLCVHPLDSTSSAVRAIT